MVNTRVKYREFHNYNMDLLGQKGEEAAENSEHLEEQIQSLQSHVNAMDNALQEFESRFNSLQQNFSGGLKEDVEENKRELEDLENIFRRLSKIQSEQNKRLRQLNDSKDDVGNEISVLKQQLKNEQNNSQNLEKRISKIEQTIDNQDRKIFERVKALEEKVGDIEEQFILDSNRQEWDIDSKVEKSLFKNRTKKIDRELSKLRTSINSLADEVNAEDVEIDE